MNKLAIVLTVGATALLGASAASASDNSVQAKAWTGITQSSSTDFSSRHRHYRHYRVYRHYPRYGYARPYYRSYGYYDEPGYGYGRPYGGYYGRPYGYYGGGPGISFSFGSGW